MKKVTIIGLGGAGINFLNYLKKKELDNLDLKLLPLEDENIDKNLIEKEIIKDSKVFVVFGVGRIETVCVWQKIYFISNTSRCTF